MLKINTFIAVCMLSIFWGYSQAVGLTILGSPNQINSGSTINITAGNKLTFRITNTETGNCGNLKIEDVNINNTANFKICGSVNTIQKCQKRHL